MGFEMPGSITADVYGQLLTQDLEPAAVALDHLVHAAFVTAERSESVRDVSLTHEGAFGTTLL